MNYKKALLLIITLGCTFGLGPYSAYLSSIEVLVFMGIDLDAQPSLFAAIMLIVFLVLWYAVFCFIGLLLGLVIARPFCGASAITVLNLRGSFKIPVFTALYDSVLYTLYKGES